MPLGIGAGASAGIFSLQRNNSIFQQSQKNLAAGKSARGAANGPAAYALSQSMAATLSSLQSSSSVLSTQLVAGKANILDLRYAQDLVRQMNNLASAVQNAGVSGAGQGQGGGGAARVIAAPTANISANTAVDGAVVGDRISITTDSGRNFTYTISGPTSWGDIAAAANASNTGITMRFDGAGGSSRIVIEANEGFTLDQWSSKRVMDDLTGLNSPYDGGQAWNTFGGMNPADYPGQRWVSPTTVGGMRFGNGGAVTANNFVFDAAAGSSITFAGSDGVTHSWTASAKMAIEDVAGEINAMNTGVKAEFDANGKLRLRDKDNGAVTILGGAGTFDPAGGQGRLTQVTAPPPSLPGGGQVPPGPQSPFAQMYNDLRTELGTVLSGLPNLYGTSMVGGPNQIGNVTAAIDALPPVTNWSGAADVATSLAAGQQLYSQLLSRESTYEYHQAHSEGFLANRKAYAADLNASSFFAHDPAADLAALSSSQIGQQLAGKAVGAGNKAANAMLKMLAF